MLVIIGLNKREVRKRKIESLDFFYILLKKLINLNTTWSYKL